MQHATLTDLNSALVQVLIRSTINVHYNFGLLQCEPKYEILHARGCPVFLQVADQSDIFDSSMRLPPGLSRIKSFITKKFGGIG